MEEAPRPANPPDEACTECTVHHLIFPSAKAPALPPDRLTPQEIASLRRAMKVCPILRD